MNDTRSALQIIKNRYESLILELEQLRVEINEDNVNTIVFKYYDNILIKLLELFNYENRLMSKDMNSDSSEHIKEHSLLLYDLVKMFGVDNISHSDLVVLTKELIKSISEHFLKYKCNASSNKVDVLLGQKKYFGCLLFAVCEYGFFIKVYGETDMNLLVQMGIKAEEYRKQFYSKDLEWGEVLDIRGWDLMTNESMLLAREHTKNAVNRNKKYTIYVTGNSNINDYIARNISKETEIISINDLFQIIQVMSEKKLRLGKIIAIDSIGNLNYVKE